MKKFALFLFAPIFFLFFSSCYHHNRASDIENILLQDSIDNCFGEFTVERILSVSNNNYYPDSIRYNMVIANAYNNIKFFTTIYSMDIYFKNIEVTDSNGNIEGFLSADDLISFNKKIVNVSNERKKLK